MQHTEEITFRIAWVLAMGCNGCDLLRQVRDMPFALLESDRLVGASWQATDIHIPIY